MNIRNLQIYLRKNKIDVSIFMSLNSTTYDNNLYYFSGYSGNGILIIPKSSRPFLVVPEMEREKASKTSKVRSIIVWKKKEDLFELLRELFKKKKIRSKVIGLDLFSISVLLFRDFKKGLKKSKFKDISNICRFLRTTKTKEEIKTIRKAFSIANKILIKTIRNFKRFKTELDVANYLKIESIKKGCELSFPSIVASGKNASMPHYSPTNCKLKKGFCVIDFGVRYQGYCTDITRTIFLGKPSERENEIYNILLDSQKKAIKQVKNGTSCSDLYNSVVENLGDHSKYFTHGLGHGVGLNIHELPNLKDKSKDNIEKNMVFTIEPGIYISGKLGIRIEDTLLFSNKTEILTKVPKHLITIR
ncbi:M24 family metallopeptidase [Nanoarchaeota archaeon]